jgi:ATP-binding cassette subfamily C (CFTR/MRP) protein 1
VERIANSLQNIHKVWAAPAEIAIGVWLLEGQIGVSCVVLVVVAISK